MVGVIVPSPTASPVAAASHHAGNSLRRPWLRLLGDGHAIITDERVPHFFSMDPLRLRAGVIRTASARAAAPWRIFFPCGHSNRHVCVSWVLIVSACSRRAIRSVRGLQRAVPSIVPSVAHSGKFDPPPRTYDRPERVSDCRTAQPLLTACTSGADCRAFGRPSVTQSATCETAHEMHGGSSAELLREQRTARRVRAQRFEGQSVEHTNKRERMSTSASQGKDLSRPSSFGSA
jgi:hypothetical protein